MSDVVFRIGDRVGTPMGNGTVTQLSSDRHPLVKTDSEGYHWCHCGDVRLLGSDDKTEEKREMNLENEIRHIQSQVKDAQAARDISKAPKPPKAEPAFDAVKRPSHYCVGGYECRDIIEALGLGFYLGNAFKYLWRAGRKGDAIEDLRKAARNIEYEIERLEKQKP